MCDSSVWHRLHIFHPFRKNFVCERLCAANCRLGRGRALHGYCVTDIVFDPLFPIQKFFFGLRMRLGNDASQQHRSTVIIGKDATWSLWMHWILMVFECTSSFVNDWNLTHSVLVLVLSISFIVHRFLIMTLTYICLLVHAEMSFHYSHQTLCMWPQP